jgi:hypothetical protein
MNMNNDFLMNMDLPSSVPLIKSTKFWSSTSRKRHVQKVFKAAVDRKWKLKAKQKQLDHKQDEQELGGITKLEGASDTSEAK